MFIFKSKLSYFNILEIEDDKDIIEFNTLKPLNNGEFSRNFAYVKMYVTEHYNPITGKYTFKTLNNHGELFEFINKSDFLHFIFKTQPHFIIHDGSLNIQIFKHIETQTIINAFEKIKAIYPNLDHLDLRNIAMEIGIVNEDQFSEGLLVSIIRQLELKLDLCLSFIYMASVFKRIGGSIGERFNMMLINEFGNLYVCELYDYFKPKNKMEEEIAKKCNNKIKGGFVLEVNKCYDESKYLYDIDFERFYPNIFIQYNICISTLTDNTQEVNNATFSPEWIYGNLGFIPQKTRIGIIPLILMKLLHMRNLNKGTPMEKILKLASNCVYGYFATKYNMFSSIIIANIVTFYGRYHIKQVVNILEENKYIIQGGDTDSLFVSIPRDKHTTQTETNLLKLINQYLPPRIKMSVKGVYDSFLLLSKKTKVCVNVEKHLLVDTGIINRSRNKFTNIIIQTCLNMIMVGKKGVDEIKDYLLSVTSELKSKKMVKTSLLVHYIKLSLTTNMYNSKSPYYSIIKEDESLNLIKNPNEHVIAYFYNRNGIMVSANVMGENPNINDLNVNIYLNDLSLALVSILIPHLIKDCEKNIILSALKC